MDINELKQDDTIAENGTWVEFENARFKIRSTDSKGYRRVMTQLAKKRNLNKIRNDGEAMNAMSVESLALGILIAWEGVTENGVPLPFTNENRLKVCRIESVRNFLSTEAQDVQNFQQEALAEDAAELKSGD